MSVRFRLAAGAALLLWAITSLAAPIVYPKDGQSPEQQQQDQAECHTWSVQSTGFDPANPPPPQSAPPPAQAPRGGVVRGAARGAVLGEVIDDDWETGAKAGAVVGGFRRHDQRRQQAAQQQSYEQQYQQQLAAQTDQYNRAFGACMEGRGYVVN